MATQADIDDVTAQLTQQNQTLATIKGQVETLEAQNKAAGSPLDLTGLNAALAAHTTAIDAIEEDFSANSATTPAPASSN